MSGGDARSVDLGFRPATFFAPRPPELHLIGKVRNAALRTRLLDLLAAGKRAEVRALLRGSGLSLEEQKAYERLHPKYMGGNYLPRLEEGEVEIARVVIDSTTSDVTAVYARQDGGTIVLRVVDEYEGDTLMAPAEHRAASPLPLGEFVDLFFAAWPLDEICEMNHEGDLPGQLGFFDAQSDVYPDFEAACASRVSDCFRQRHREASQGRQAHAPPG
jgi:hypothetical protein